LKICRDFITIWQE